MIYFDEAGNSGGNLLDKDQPVFVLASHNFDLEETRHLLDPLFALSKADELHFSNLKKYNKFRNALISMFNNELFKEDRVYHYIADKKLMVSAQMVDMLIEPVLYDNDIDIYQDGSNIAMTNVLYFTGKNFWKTDYDHICELFVKWARSAADIDWDNYWHAVKHLHDKTKKGYRDLLLAIMLSTPHLYYIKAALNKYSLDVTLSCFVDHCNFWAKRYGKLFDVTFDESKQIEYWKDMIDFLTHHLPEGEVGFGTRKHKYPLLINSLTTAKSHDCIQLQLADLIASTLNYYSTKLINGEDDDFSKQLSTTRLFHHTLGNKIWPTTKITPEDLGMTDPSGINPLDFLAHAALKNPEKYRKARG